MTIQRYEGNGRMSKAVVHNGIVYLCGQVDGSNSDIKNQAKETLAKVDALLVRWTRFQHSSFQPQH